MEEVKMVKVSMEGDVITVSFDGNLDGQPSVELKVYGKEGIEEALNAIMNLFKKK